jgi:hypothetical protein
MRTLLVALVLVIGCGSNEAASPFGAPDAAVAVGKDAGPDLGPDLGPDSSPDVFVDPLIGTWVNAADPNQAFRFKFDGTNFELDSLVSLSNGDVGMFIQQGTYSFASNTAARLRLRASSCQGVRAIANTTSDMPFERAGNSLSVTIGTVYLVMQLSTTPPTGMGTATIGCFKDDGTFVAHVTSPVP